MVEQQPPNAVEKPTTPETTFLIETFALATGKRDKIKSTSEGGQGKFQGRDKDISQILQGGDEVVFSVEQELLNGNSLGVVAIGACFDGMSAGGKGDRCALQAARETYRYLEFLLIALKKKSSKAQVVDLITDFVIAPVNEEVLKTGKQIVNELTDKKSYHSSLSLYIVQEEKGQRYLHCFNVGDSQIEIAIETDSGFCDVIPATIPHNLATIQARNDKSLHFQEVYTSEDNTVVVEHIDPDKVSNIRAARQIYEEHAQEMPQKIASAVSHALGEDKLKVFYVKIPLPEVGAEWSKKGKITAININALSDGIYGVSSLEERSEAYKASSAREATQKLQQLGHTADADDYSNVVTKLKAIKAVEIDSGVADVELGVKESAETKAQVYQFLTEFISQTFTSEFPLTLEALDVLIGITPEDSQLLPILMAKKHVFNSQTSRMQPTALTDMREKVIGKVVAFFRQEHKGISSNTTEDLYISTFRRLVGYIANNLPENQIDQKEITDFNAMALSRLGVNFFQSQYNKYEERVNVGLDVGEEGCLHKIEDLLDNKHYQDIDLVILTLLLFKDSELQEKLKKSRINFDKEDINEAFWLLTPKEQTKPHERHYLPISLFAAKMQGMLLAQAGLREEIVNHFLAKLRQEKKITWGDEDKLSYQGIGLLFHQFVTNHNGYMFSYVDYSKEEN